MQDCDIAVSTFKLKSHYYTHFQIITLVKLLPFSYGLNSTLLFFYKDDFGIL